MLTKVEVSNLAIVAAINIPVVLELSNNVRDILTSLPLYRYLELR